MIQSTASQSVVLGPRSQHHLGLVRNAPKCPDLDLLSAGPGELYFSHLSREFRFLGTKENHSSRGNTK